MEKGLDFGWTSGVCNLEVALPYLFALATNKEAWVQDVWHVSNEGGCWAPGFIRYVNDWELEAAERFLLRLQGKIVQSKEDKWVWDGVRDSKFYVKWLYKELELRRLKDFPFKVIWKS